MNVNTKRWKKLARPRRGWNPILRWNLANVAINTDSAGNRTMHKGKSTGRIDGAIGSWMAVARAASFVQGPSWLENPELDVEGFFADI